MVLRGGITDPVEDDEAHAADHDHETAYEEGGGLRARERQTNPVELVCTGRIKEQRRKIFANLPRFFEWISSTLS